MSKAKVEFHTLHRHYHVGDEVLPEDITLNVHELCLATTDVAAKKYTVTLKANGGTGNDITTSTEGFYQLPACTFTAPKNKKFKNWAEQANGTGPKNVGDNINVVQNMSYYAIWAPIEVTVEFNANGGSGNMAAVKQNKGATYKLPECTFTAPEGQRFKGWSLDKAAVVTQITADNTTVYALWEALPK